jgi:hypothetical protein
MIHNIQQLTNALARPTCPRMRAKLYSLPYREVANIFNAKLTRMGSRVDLKDPIFFAPCRLVS